MWNGWMAVIRIFSTNSPLSCNARPMSEQMLQHDFAGLGCGWGGV
jgi:hypothetical protein